MHVEGHLPPPLQLLLLRRLVLVPAWQLPLVRSWTLEHASVAPMFHSRSFGLMRMWKGICRRLFSLSCPRVLSWYLHRSFPILDRACHRTLLYAF